MAPTQVTEVRTGAVEAVPRRTQVRGVEDRDVSVHMVALVEMVCLSSHTAHRDPIFMEIVASVAQRAHTPAPVG